jgi:hypothetical protein
MEVEKISQCGLVEVFIPPVPINSRLTVDDDVLPDGTRVGKGWFADYSARTPSIPAETSYCPCWTGPFDRSPPNMPLQGPFTPGITTTPKKKKNRERQMGLVVN